jgi:hypothetical protein
LAPAAQQFHTSFLGAATIYNHVNVLLIVHPGALMVFSGC